MAEQNDPDRRQEAPPGPPRWVKVSGIAGIVVIALLAVLLLTGGPGEHGPGRHTGGGPDDSPTTGMQEGHRPPPGAPEGHVPPQDAH